MSPTTMYARTAIIATAHPARHGWQHKDRRGQASRLDCLTAPIAPWQQKSLTTTYYTYYAQKGKYLQLTITKYIVRPRRSL